MKKDGGPAFTRVGGGEGMSLRDYFAAAALPSLISDPFEEGFRKAYAIVMDAYTIADAMLAEREKETK